jgi:hypothetical protein
VFLKFNSLEKVIELSLMFNTLDENEKSSLFSPFHRSGMRRAEGKSALNLTFEN